MAEIKASDVKKLRDLTGAGMMDCKKALAESNGDFDAAIDILRKKGQKVASKRADREAKEGCVIGTTAADGKSAYVVSLNCETDFVAKNEDFVKLTKDILTAVAAGVSDLEALKALPYGASTVGEEVVQFSGKTGEKMELAYFGKVSGEQVYCYNHMGNRLTALVAYNKALDETVAKNVAMLVASMAPIAVDKDGISQDIIDKEIEVAKEKTVQEQIQKKVEAGAFLSRERAESEQSRLQKKEQQLMVKQQYLENLSQKLSNDFMAKQAELTQQLQDSVQAYLREMNSDGRYHLILNDAVLLNKTAGSDITNEVIEGLNARYQK